MKRIATAIAALGILALAGCGNLETSAGEPLNGKALGDLTNACALSPLAETPTGSGSWAPSAQWAAADSEGTATAEGWYDNPAESQRFSVLCEAEQSESSWKVTSVEFSPIDIEVEDLTENEVSALQAAYGANYDPNHLIRLNALCAGSLSKDMAYGEADGAKVLCPEATHLDG